MVNENMGRPTLYNEPTVKISLRIPQSLHKVLQQDAEEIDCSLSVRIVDILLQYKDMLDE